MEFYKKDVIQKIVAMLLVIVITIAQFALVGTSAITYAIDMIATNNGNVEFCAYFVNENGEEVTTINKSINAENLKLKIDVAVKNEGYFNGQISLGDASFKFKNEVSSKYVSKIENNIVYLNQINAGTTATIELGIEYNRSGSEIEKASLNKECEINLTGTYVSSQKSTDINGKSVVNINWISPSDITAQLAAKILTNSIYKIGEENKRIVQILVGSKIEDNAYPVKNTKIEMSVPDGVEEVAVHKRTTNATNGDNEFTTNNYQYNTETGTLTINIVNNENQNGKIDWTENAQDILVVTYKYPETIDLANQEIIVNGTITAYDEKDLKEQVKATIQEDVDGIVTNSITERENEIYKGKMYIAQERDYNTITTLNIDYKDAINSTEIKENEAIFVTDSLEEEANIQYKQTTINRNEFIKIFGENGYVTIQDQNGNIVANITKDSQTNEDGNIIVNYASGVIGLTIKTSAPTTNGILNIEHTKTILSTGYSRKEITSLTGIKESIESKYVSSNNKENLQTSDKTITLKETETTANLSLETESLSATGENKILKMQVVLESNNEKQDLYKNPVLKITFPEEINVVAATASPVYSNQLEIANKSIDPENGKQVLTIELQGEQTSYSSEAERGTTILVEVMTQVDKLTASGQEEILLNYTNKNAISYANNGQDKAKINLINENSMIITNNIDEYGISTFGNEETKEAEMKIGQSENITIDMQVVNNEGNEISDVAILGKIPTLSGENDTAIKLISGINITSSTNDATIYYTDVENPTKDLTNTENKWSTTSNEFSKNYLIVVDDMEQGESISANYKLNVYSKTYDLKLESGYIVSYTNTISNAKKTANSTTILLTTGDASNIKQGLIAKVGTDVLTSGDEVNAGEIIDYTITLENNGNIDATDLNVKANIPEGTTYIEYNEEYINNPEEIGGAQYRPLYTENTELKEKVFSNVTIPAGRSISLNYSIRVNEQITDGTKVTTIAEATNDSVDISKKIEHTLKSADIVTSISRPLGNNEKELAVGSTHTYTLNIKNISNVEKQNIKVSINSNELLKIDSIRYIEKSEGKNTSDSEFTIGSLSAGEEMNIDIYVIVNQPTEDLKTTAISAVITDSENKTYRTNEVQEEVEKVGVALEQTSNIDEKYVEPGENISYIITMENTGKIDMKNLYISDKFIAEYLELQSITLNGKETTFDTTEMKISDKKYLFIEIKTPLDVGEKATIVVNAKVKEDLSTENEIEIANLVEAYNEYSIAEQEIKHYMKPTEINNGSEENPGEENPGEENPGEENPGEENPGEENPGEENPGEENPGEENPGEENPGEETPGEENPGGENPGEEKPGGENPGEETPGEEKPGEEKPGEEKPGGEKPGEEKPGGEKPGEENPGEDFKNEVYSISGVVWLDEDEDGIKDSSERLLNGIDVILLDITNNKIVQDANGINISAKTDNQGKYVLANIPNGKYMVIFEYNTEQYVVTTYQTEKATEYENSDAISKNITIDGESKKVAATDTINISENMEDIDLGLVESKVFDLELDKYVSKIVVSNAQGTSTYNFDDETLAKVEIGAKYLSGSSVVIEYKIKITNTGELAGYVREVVDYLPSGLIFSTSLNKDWYQSGNYIYNSSLSDTKIEPGETKELTLVATKTMTESNTGLVNNKAEIQTAYNSSGIQDVDSIPGNQSNSEDDLGSADIIIVVKTGGAIMYISLVIGIMAVIGIGAYVINKKLLSRKI